MDILASATQRAAMPSPHPGGTVLYASTSVGGSFTLKLERGAFGLMRPKGDGSDDNLLQKIRNQVKLAHEQSWPFHTPKC
jgi:hypothetical protein